MCNPNIVGRYRFQWSGVECDLLDDDGVLIAKGQLIACDPMDTILDDQLGEDHVGLCIMCCLSIISAVMTIWRWPYAQTILDGYSL